FSCARTLRLTPELAIEGLLLRRILFYLAVDAAIFTAEEKQRFTFAHHNIFNLGDEDGVITRVLRGMQLALEVSQGAAQHRRTVLSTVKARSHFFGVLTFDGARIVLGDRPLFLREHVDAEALSSVQVSVCPRPVIHTHQHQHGIERYGCKRISRHAVYRASIVHCHHGYTGGKCSHGSAKISLTDAHRKGPSPSLRCSDPSLTYHVKRNANWI